MFKNWGAWLGIEPEKGQAKGGEDSAAGGKGGNPDVNKPIPGAGGEQITSVQEEQLLQQAKGLGGESVSNPFVFNGTLRDKLTLRGLL